MMERFSHLRRKEVINICDGCRLGCVSDVVIDLKFGRVAVGDDVAALLNARLVVVLVGERPGLSSPDSLGVYMTYAPTPGLTDEARNCISNVRAAGLPVEEAVRKLCYLVENALVQRLSGVDLKDDVPPGYLPFAETRALG